MRVTPEAPDQRPRALACAPSPAACPAAFSASTRRGSGTRVVILEGSDEGSAYWIGRAAARAALRWEDQAEPSPAVPAGIKPGKKGVSRVPVAIVGQKPRHRGDNNPQRFEIGFLAGQEPGFTCWPGENGTPGNLAIGQARWHCRAGSRDHRDRRLGPLPVAGAGGVFRAPVIWDRFAELTGATRPLAPAAVGAALLAGLRVRDSA
jgi:hypothetical protein